MHQKNWDTEPKPKRWIVGRWDSGFLVIADADTLYPIAAIDLEYHGTGAKPTEEQEENARLMAASPQLLEACELGLEWVGREFSNPESISDYKKILAAIAAATGGDNAKNG